jgi:hypothetical protein
MGSMGVDRRGRGWRFWCAAGGVIVAVLLGVWTSAQVGGLLVHGSWPHVAVPWSIVELLRVLTGQEPVGGIPVGLFWLCLLLEVGTALVLALSLRHRLRGGHRHVWVPRPPEGIAKPRSFRDGYRRLARADIAQAAKLGARRAEPAWDGDAGLPRQEVVASLSVEQAARLLADHFTREQLGALVGELAERRMAGEVSR